MNERFTMPNTVPSPYNKTTKALIPELPTDDSTYWRVKGGRPLELVWTHLEEQAARAKLMFDYLNTLTLTSARAKDGTLVPSAVVYDHGRFVGMVSAKQPADRGWTAAPMPQHLVQDTKQVMGYWVPNPHDPAGLNILDLLERSRQRDPEQLHFALFGNHGAAIKTPGGVAFLVTKVFCFLHASARPQAYLRVHKSQNFAMMSPEVRVHLEQVPGSRFWRLVELEHTAQRELAAQLAKVAKRNAGKPKGRR